LALSDRDSGEQDEGGESDADEDQDDEEASGSTRQRTLATKDDVTEPLSQSLRG